MVLTPEKQRADQLYHSGLWDICLVHEACMCSFVSKYPRLSSLATSLYIMNPTAEAILPKPFVVQPPFDDEQSASVVLRSCGNHNFHVFKDILVAASRFSAQYTFASGFVFIIS